MPLDEPATASSATPAAKHDPRIGARIGPYALIARLGEGGFGVVYLAERREPMYQRVALKVIKAGMDTNAVIARFEQERQALAVMDHPHVAKVFDGGETEHGQPYFAMELVQGEPINSFCDRHRYTIRQRLELFISVCEAVQHAHHKGIIHRDIKPSNVLVSTKDDKAIAKVIDFGVARAINRTLTDKTIFTEAGQLIGTPEYMSPEQAEMGRLDIDTRTDVYSLGMMLYELLSGVLPFDPGTMRAAGYAEIQRMIREDEPPRPSTRLSTLDKAAGALIARTRQDDCDHLQSELRRELEWIPLKALRKDRTRRYGSAESLAQDVRRYLRGLPLEAAPESNVYRARKFIYRYRFQVIACVCVAISVVVGGVATTISLVRAQTTVRQLRAERDLRNELDRLDGLIREAQFDRGNVSAISAALNAANGFERVLGPGDRRTLSAWAVHANMHFAADKLADGKALYEECIRQRIKYLGPGDEWTIGVMNEYADILYAMQLPEAEAAVLSAGTAAKDHAAIGNATRDRIVWRAANLLLDSGRHAEALPFYEALVESIPNRKPPAEPQELSAAQERVETCRRASKTPPSP